jgi:hypothetical protein
MPAPRLFDDLNFSGGVYFNFLCMFALQSSKKAKTSMKISANSVGRIADNYFKVSIRE